MKPVSAKYESFVARILDLDIENRPLAYLSQDFTTAEITAIAACWVGEPKSMRVWLLGRDEPKRALAEFAAMYAEADIVTGHYLRAHDLPVLNRAMLEYGLPPLGAKDSIDTKLDLVKGKHLSASQENLAAALGIPEGKAHMSNASWREANRLTPAGLKLTEARVRGDVLQHMALRKKLAELGHLNAPKVWRP